MSEKQKLDNWDKLKKILIQYTNAEDVKPDSHLIDDLGFDSIKMLSFIIQIEDTFGVEINGKDIENDVLLAPRNIINFIKSGGSLRTGL